MSLNVPNGVRLPDIHRVLDDLTPRLLASRPEVSFYDGQELCFPLVDFVIRTQRFAPAKILGTASYPVSSLGLRSRHHVSRNQRHALQSGKENRAAGACA